MSRGAALAVAAALIWAAPAGAESVAEILSREPWSTLRGLLSDARSDRKEAADRLIAGGDRSLVAPLVDSIFFTARPERGTLYEVLEALTGERFDGYYAWVEYVGAHPEPPPPDGYLAWKLALLQLIDPDYARIFYPGAPARIRLEEIVSGGVPLAGIPAIDRPATVAAGEAGFMKRRERVFGVLAGGEARAYPVRVLSWHEMLNDEVGGRPVTLSFCTLCGSGILYATATAGGGAYTFDTSGLLYRSNKLMVDRQTWTLWSNLTGEPVVGRRARGDVRLEVLPSTITTWEAWRARHPDTRVLDVPELERTVDRRHGFVYREGAADRARTGVSFPVWLRSDRLERDAEVFALRLGGAAKAYPLEALLARGVVNDRLDGHDLVLLADRDTREVRAYRRDGRTFRRGPRRDLLLDERDGAWSVGETALEAAGEGGERLERLPGHVAFWFGWYAFYPQTELFDG